MPRGLLVVVLLTLATAAHAERPLTQVLFDFEGGIEGWWGNVYNGPGTCKPSATTDARFGSGALHCEVTGVEGGSNTVCPWFPADVPWRQWEWGVISLWVKGDGTPYQAKLTVTTGLEGDDQQLNYAFSLPLDSTDWRQVRAPVRAFWNRERIPMDTRRIGRLMFGCSGTHSFSIDQIVLEAPQRPVPLVPTGQIEGLDLAPRLLQFVDGRYGLMLDPTPLGADGAVISAEFAVTGGAGQRFSRPLPPGGPAGEALIELPAPEESGQVTLTLTATRNEQTLSRARYSTSLVASRPAPEPTPLQLVPAPKEFSELPGSFPLSDPVVFTVKAGTADARPALNLLRDEIGSWGLTVPAPTTGLAEGLSEISLGAPPPLAQEHAQRVGQLPAEGYLLEASSAGVRIVAQDTRGLVNGACTLLQAVESQWAQQGELTVPGMRVFDWPNLPIRTLSLSFPTSRWGHPNDPPVDPEFFQEYLRQTVVKLKLNMVVLLVDQGVQFETHPEVAGPAAWPKSVVRNLVQMLRSYGVEPVPGENSLGHANWLCIPHKELAEDGDVHQICTSNPDSKRIMLDIYQELIDLFEAKYFHVGLDEIRWNTHNLPEDQRCPLCRNRSKQDIFVEWVWMLRDFLAAQNVKMMMWGDMILPGHNGGPPYNLAQTVDRLPKDVIICNWSSSLVPDAAHWYLQHGYEAVIKANSRGTTLQDQQWVIGNMMGVWFKTPWLHEHVQPNLNEYAYSSQVLAAEYSWNHWPNLFDASLPLDATYFAARPLVQWRLAARPVAGAADRPRSVTLSGAGADGLPEGPVTFGQLNFAVAPTQAVAPEPGAEAVVPLGQPVRAVYLLHAARLENRDAMTEGFKSKQNWQGVPIAEYLITYASGQVATLPIYYGYHVRDPQPGWGKIPNAYGAFGVFPVTFEATGLHLYPLQWTNPRPEDPVASIRLRTLQAPARLILAALAVQ